MNVQHAINAGLFVEFVYSNWTETAPIPDLDGREVVTDQGTPVVAGTTYTVVKTIYANDLATVLNANLPCSRDYTTIGILAKNDADPTDYVVAIRGTDNIWEWIQDAKFLWRDFPPVPWSGLTEDGFTDMYLSFSLTTASTTGFMQAIATLVPAGATVTVAGHSLGASLATLFAFDMAHNTKFPVVLYTLASPRVGDLIFGHVFDKLVPNAYRVANRNDLVTHLPTPPMYYHVGDETELLPPSDMKQNDIVCNHNLKNYFHMLGLSIIPADGAAYPIAAGCDCPSTASVATAVSTEASSGS